MKLQLFTQVITISTVLLLEGNRGVKAAPFEPTNTDSQSPQENSFNGNLRPSVDILNLIERATLPPGRKPEQFDLDSQQNIQNAAEKYKKQQIQQVEKPSPTGLNIP